MTIGVARGKGRTYLANAILGGVALGCAASAVYGLMIAVPPDDPWLFPMLVGLPGITAIALAASLRLPQDLRINVGLLVGGVGVTLYAIEAVLEVLPPRTELTPAQAAAASGSPFDRRTRLQVVDDLRAAGMEAYVTLPADILRAPASRGGAQFMLHGRSIVPLTSIRNRVLVHCNESGRYSIFRSGPEGFNNPPQVLRAPLDIAAIGDSFVQGACVDSSETLMADIRRKVPAAAGLGLDGAGPLSELGIIKEYLPPVRPRDVLWFYFEGNDLSNLESELEFTELRLYLEPGKIQGLVARAREIDSVEIRSNRILRNIDSPEGTNHAGGGPSVLRWARLNRLRDALALGAVAARLQACCALDALDAVLREGKRTVESWGGRLYFVYLPAPGRYLRPLSPVFTDELRYRGRVLRLVRRAGLPIIDIDASFREVDDKSRLFFGVRSHYTPAGYQVAADAVLRYLAEERH